MLEAVFVLAAKQSQFYFELAAAIRHELEALGVRASQSTEGFPAPRAGLAYVLLAPHEYFALEGHAFPPDATTFHRSVLICADRAETTRFEQNLALSEGAAAVFDINRRSMRAFRERGVAAEHLRIGYTPYWDRFDAGSERPVDVAFIGAYTPRRGRVLGGYAKALSRRYCQIHLSDNSTPNSADSVSLLTGEPKWALLAGAKTLLNVHQGDDPSFEWLRVAQAMHAGCVVVSEASADCGPLVPGRHLVMGRAHTLDLLVQELLENPQEMDKMRSCALEFLRDELPMSTQVARLASAIETAAAAPIARRGADLRRPAGPQHLQGLSQPGPPAATGDSDSTAIRRAVKDTHLQLLELRRGIASIGETLRTGKPPALRFEAATSAYGACRQPRVSILTAFFNDADHICAALNSVVANHFGDLEILVVDDGSTDDSLPAVKRWLVEHDHIPAAVISHPVNRGLPRARNTGLDFARGELSLILGADDELLAPCLGRLLHALDSRPQAAFAYPILEAFDANGPSHLISQYDWDPPRLGRENYIHALALIRTRVLRGIGGFATDRRLDGVEDWDLWATMADAGHRGLFVREILGRFRVPPASRLSITNISPTVMYAAMLERHPDLMNDVKPPLSWAGA